MWQLKNDAAEQNLIQIKESFKMNYLNLFIFAGVKVGSQEQEDAQ